MEPMGMPWRRNDLSLHGARASPGGTMGSIWDLRLPRGQPLRGPKGLCLLLSRLWTWALRPKVATGVSLWVIAALWGS
ncbi:unnamed protein product [Boreogadus saida]